MTLLSQLHPELATRRLGAVPWHHAGPQGLAVRVGSDVPSFDDPMIRSALIRGARTCNRIEGMDRALSRELWPLGYVARLEAGEAGRPIVLVEIANSR
jgi:hypothetical protein